MANGDNTQQPIQSNQPPQATTPSPQPTEEIAAIKSQVSSLAQQMEQIQPFVDDASILISSIYQNPELRRQVADSVQQFGQRAQQTQQPDQQPQQPAQQPQQPAPQPPQSQPTQQTPPQAPQGQAQPVQDPRFDSVDMKMRDDIVKQVEQKYGYHKLPAEERKVLRQGVEKRLNQWNTSIFTAPVDSLQQSLEDAYLLADLPKAKEQGRIEGLVDARTTDMGALPTMGTQQPESTENQLTADHKQWAKKMGVAEDRVAGHLKELNEKGVITYKPKEQPQAAPQTIPSGQPTPPAPLPQIAQAPPAQAPQPAQ